MNRAITRDEIRWCCAMTIRTLRSSAGWAQEGLANESGISRGFMGQLERGESTPTIETVCRLLPCLDVSIVGFFEEFERARTRLRRNSGGETRRAPKKSKESR